MLNHPIRLALAAWLLVIVGSAAAEAAQFKVGIAEADITPEKPMPMWGYGDRHAMLSTGVRDPLYAKAVVIDLGEDKLAIVGLDLGRSPMADMMVRIREAVKEQAGVNYVMMSGSHTHHGPVLELADEAGKGKGKFDDGVAYVESLEGKLVGVINAAAKNVQDARIGWGSTDVHMNRNRHTKIEPKPTDPELNVIRFDDAQGKPIAIITNYNAHPTMLPGEDLRFSAEWPGQLQEYVEKELGAQVSFMQGAAGDMSVQTTEETKSIETFGAAIGQHAVEVAKAIETKAPETPSIQVFEKEYSLDPRIDLTNKMIQGIFKQAFFPELAERALDELGDGKIEPVLTVVLLNNELAFVGGSGEFFCQHSLRLKERSRVKTIFYGYCNGHHMYFPTVEGAAEGGYGADPTVSWVPLGTGEMMMNDALIAIYRMLGKYTNPFEQAGS